MKTAELHTLVGPRKLRTRLRTSKAPCYLVPGSHVMISESDTELA